MSFRYAGNAPTHPSAPRAITPGTLHRSIVILILFMSARSSFATTMYVTGAPSDVYQVNDGSLSPFAPVPFSSPHATASPHGIAIDASGNFYIAALNLDQITRITPGGIATTYATLPTGSQPWGIALDTHGNLFVAESKTDQISEVAPDGTVTSFASVHAPIDLTFDKSGNLYVTLSGGVSQVDQITPTGSVSLYCTLPTSSAPRGLAFDSTGNLYVAGGATDQITKTTPDGTVSLFATLPAGSGPHGLAIDSSDNLYTADRTSNQISEISPDGHTVSTLVSGITTPTGIAMAPEPASLSLLAVAMLALLRRKHSEGK